MKIDFSRLCIKQIDGTSFPKEECERIRKSIGSRLYYQSVDDLSSELGRKIWHASGELELVDEEVSTLRKVIEPLPAITRQAFEQLLNEK